MVKDGLTEHEQVLATADKLVAHYEWLLANFCISKKNEGWSYNVNNARPEAVEIIDTYKRQRKNHFNKMVK